MSMKKVLFVIVIVAIFGGAAWYFWPSKTNGNNDNEKKTPVNPPNVPPVVKPATPQNVALFPDSGEGKILIDSRLRQYDQSGRTEYDAEQYGFFDKSIAGVTAGAFFLQNSAGNLPHRLSEKQAAVLKKGEKLELPTTGDNWTKVKYLQDWFKAFKSAFPGASILPAEAFESDLNKFLRSYIGVVYTKLPDNIKKYDTKEFERDLVKAVNDAKTFSGNYLAVNDDFLTGQKNAAISELKNAGYKFAV